MDDDLMAGINREHRNVTTPARWREDFPIAAGEDSYATRREFTKFLGLTSLAFLFGTGAAAVRTIWRRFTGQPGQGMAVAAPEDIAVGGYKLFRYPSENDPCILLRLQVDKFVAFNQNCTHLSCPVHFNAAENQLVCPCHHGYFGAEDGRPVAGPARLPLKQLVVTLRQGQIWVEPSDTESI